MRKYSLLPVLIVFVSCVATAQLHPAEGSKLNYLIVGFSIPAATKTTGYTILVVPGNYTNEAEFRKNIGIKSVSKSDRSIIELPAFGLDYTWCARDNASGRKLTGLMHFSTLKSPNTDAGSYRLRIKKNATKYADAFVFNDKTKVMYDMRGKAVWFLPDIKGILENTSEIRDIKLTQQNTITFLTYNMAYEISYDGEILWKAPNDGKVSGDGSEHYHHEMTRLSNGHYMILGHEMLNWEWVHNGSADSSIRIVEAAAPGSNIRPKKMQMGTVIEYDADGSVVWSWKASRYYNGANLQRLLSPMGMNESHENAFFLDEGNHVIYVSFKNTCQVLKIKYPEGTILAAYGGVQYNNNGKNISLFSEQHSCKLNSVGKLMLYNNNTADLTSLPGVMVLNEEKNGALKTTWQYEYPDASKGNMRVPLTSGGNVTELPDQSLFVSSCIPYANLFIVTKNKQLLWDASLEKWENNTWNPLGQYRASIILNRKRLEQLIWNGKH